MAELKAVISQCIIIGSNLMSTLNRNRYLSRLSDKSAEINLSVFETFARDSTNTLLGLLYKLGHFNGYEELLHIAGEIIEKREAVNHKEEDVGGYVDFLLFNYRRIRLTDQANTANDAGSRKRRSEEELETRFARKIRFDVNAHETTSDITSTSVQRSGGPTEEASSTEASHSCDIGDTISDNTTDNNEEKGVCENLPNSSSETEEGEAEEDEQQQHERLQISDINFNHVDLLSENTRHFRKFGVIGREASFAIRPMLEGGNIYRSLENAFQEIHGYALRSSNPNDYVGLTFDSPNLTHGPAGISFRPARDLNSEDIWKLVSSLAQSAGGLDIAEHFNIRIFNVTVPSGRGRVRLTRENVVVKRSILSIKNTDNLCFPRALVAARIYCERGKLRAGELHEKWNAVRTPQSSLQKELANQLTRNAGVVIPEEGCGIREIERFQQHLAVDNIAIIVYDFNTFARGGKPMYDGTAILASLRREPTLTLNIMYYEHSRHYNTILNLKSAAGCNYYCAPCNVGFWNTNGHRCSNKCSRCLTVPPCNQTDVEILKCNVCNRAFFGAVCFERHRSEKSFDGKSTPSICDAVRFCGECGRIVKSRIKHECGLSYCKLCRTPKDGNHLCYMQPLNRENRSTIEPSTAPITDTQPDEETNIRKKGLE
ncbi:uncharacterized protein [Anoplolepis gracilipes]|uniref:uncharacterized protein n=1 Tax=Anoplolepis gracilipes TaxID=354296 RepID=UPI003B9F58B8